MIKHLKKIGWLGLCLGVMTSCRQSYPEVYLENEGVDNPNQEVTNDGVPIMLSLSDPSYSIIARGTGPFQGIETSEDALEKWLNSKFYVYAFLSNNHEYTGPLDYSADEQIEGHGTPFCLVNDRPVRMTATREWEWVPDANGNTPQLYYSMSHQNYKYNFFCYYLDNAQVFGTKKEQTKLTKVIGIDGTQDLVSAYGKPTAEQIEAIEQDEDFKYLAAHWEDLIYSTRTGHRGIVPVLHTRHEMAKFQFALQGESDMAKEISVCAIKISTPVHGDFVVASDYAYGVTPKLGITWNESEREDLFVPTSYQNEFGYTKDMAANIFNPYIPVTSGEIKNVGVPLILPPIRSFDITIYYSINAAEGSMQTTNYSNVTLGNDETTGEPRNFEAGKEYTIVLKVYGPQPVGDFMIKTGLGWDDGGDITLPEDHM